LKSLKCFNSNHLVKVRSQVLWDCSPSNQNVQLFCHCLEDGRHYFEDTINQAKQAALNILVIVSQNSVKHIEELDLVLDNRHPAEVQLKQEKKREQAFAPNHNGVMLMELDQ